MRGPSLAELKTAIRALRRSPTVTLVSVLCLSLGIGATTALSSALHRALLKPLPFANPEQLVSLHRTTPQSGPDGAWSQSAANFLDFQRRSKTLSAIAAITWGSAVINLPDDAIQPTTNRVSANIFQLLGARAEFGRLLRPEDDDLASPATAVLSDELWRSRFGSDPTIVGRTLTINGAPTVIVGIVPPEFRVPVGGNSFRPDLWVPLRFTTEEAAQRGSNFLQTIGRLAPGQTAQSAHAELRSIFADIVRENPKLSGDNVRVAPLQAEHVKPIRTPLMLLFGAVCMVMLIAATNVAALLLARGVQRRREMAVRAALGASAADAIRVVMLESVMLGVLGVVGGIILATIAVKTIGLLAAARIPSLAGLRLEPGTLLFAIALALLTSACCSIVPAWRGARVDPQDALRGGRGGGMGRGQHRLLRSLVVVEIALSLVLLIGAGLVLKGFAMLLAKEPGFDPARILVFRVNTAVTRWPEQNAGRYFLEPALAAVRALPTVEAAASISCVPYQCWGNNAGIRYEGQTASDDTHWPVVEQRQVTAGFFDVTKQRLLSGRLLAETDDEKSPTVVVVNEALVKRDYQGHDPVGKRFYASDTSFGTIVGVVSDIRNYGPTDDPRPEMYATRRQLGSSGGSFPIMVRVRDGNPTAVAADVRRAIKSVDQGAAIAEMVGMNDLISQSLGRPRFYFSLLGAFATIAILLAIAGLYGILSYVFAQRTREIGIRSALGSTRGRIIQLVATEGLLLVGAGVALGLAGGLAVTRLMTFMLYGVSPLDPLTWIGAAGFLVLAAAAASVLPARRAARVDPLIAMQAE